MSESHYLEAQKYHAREELFDAAERVLDTFLRRYKDDGPKKPLFLIEGTSPYTMESVERACVSVLFVTSPHVTPQRLESYIYDYIGETLGVRGVRTAAELYARRTTIRGCVAIVELYIEILKKMRAEGGVY